MEQRNTIEEPATDYATVETNDGVRAVILLLLLLLSLSRARARSLSLSLARSLSLSLLLLSSLFSLFGFQPESCYEPQHFTSGEALCKLLNPLTIYQFMFF